VFFFVFLLQDMRFWAISSASWIWVARGNWRWFFAVNTNTCIANCGWFESKCGYVATQAMTVEMTFVRRARQDNFRWKVEVCGISEFLSVAASRNSSNQPIVDQTYHFTHRHHTVLSVCFVQCVNTIESIADCSIRRISLTPWPATEFEPPSCILTLL